MALEDKIPGQVVDMEKTRLSFLSGKAKELFSDGYNLVIGVDADEFVIVDPKLGIGLAEYLDKIEIKDSISGLGVDVGQKIGLFQLIRDFHFFRQAQMRTRAVLFHRKGNHQHHQLLQKHQSL